MVGHIQPRLLIHDISVQKIMPGEHGKYEDAVKIEYVRFEPSSRTIFSKFDGNLTCRGVIYIDILYSEYEDIKVITLGSIVTFEGESYTIEQIDPLYNASELNHLEVYVS